MDFTHKFIFYLLEKVFDTESVSFDNITFHHIKWKSVVVTSYNQGVSVIVIDGLQQSLKFHDEGLALDLNSEELEDLKYEWFGKSFLNEYAYLQHKEVIKRLASLYSVNGIKTMVFKGYAASLMYPKPNHRSVGDIDIYLYGKGEEADKVILSHGIEVKQNEDKHSTFTYKGVSVENHATFVNVKEHPSLAELEHCLEQEALKARYDESTGVYIPTPFSDALFLSHHLAGHFVYGGASLKQLLDWAVLANKYGITIDWNQVFEIADRAGYGKMIRCLNGIVVSHLGVSESIFPKWVRDEVLEERVLNEIIHPEIDKRGESCLGKIVRFFKSRWKYKMVFREPMIQTFFRRSWALFRERYLPHSRNVWNK